MFFYLPEGYSDIFAELFFMLFSLYVIKHTAEGRKMRGILMQNKASSCEKAQKKRRKKEAHMLTLMGNSGIIFKRNSDFCNYLRGDVI